MTVNKKYLDALTRHQVYLMRYAAGTQKKVLSLLNKTEKSLVAKIQDSLEGKNELTPKNLKNLEKLIAEIKVIRSKAWVQIKKDLKEELIDLAKADSVLARHNLIVSSPVELSPSLPPPSLLADIATSTIFEGKVLEEWVAAIQNKDAERIKDHIKIGMVQGDSVPQIVRRIVGTTRLNGKDGVTQLSRRNIAAIVRTSINAVSNKSRQEFNKQNSDIVKEELYVATLDSRTTAICQSLDGKVFPLGQGAVPPMHFNCRSLRVGIIDGKVIGTRPAKASTTKQLLREYTSSNGIKNVGSREALPFGHKTKYDSFAAKRIRELTGSIPAKTTYGEWLRSQSVEFQEDVLGKTKAKLFREGGLTLDKFVNRNGDELTIKEIIKRTTK